MDSLIGKRFNCWTVVSVAGQEGRHRVYTMRCVCGKERRRRSGKLGSTYSCGCQNKVLIQSKVAVALDSGVRKPEEPWQPDFTPITSGFKRVAKIPFWLIISGCRVIDRQPMTPAERRRYQQEAK